MTKFIFSFTFKIFFGLFTKTNVPLLFLHTCIFKKILMFPFSLITLINVLEITISNAYYQLQRRFHSYNFLLFVLFTIMELENTFWFLCKISNKYYNKYSFQTTISLFLTFHPHIPVSSFSLPLYFKSPAEWTYVQDRNQISVLTSFL